MRKKMMAFLAIIALMIAVPSSTQAQWAYEDDPVGYYAALGIGHGYSGYYPGYYGGNLGIGLGVGNRATLDALLGAGIGYVGARGLGLNRRGREIATVGGAVVGGLFGARSDNRERQRAQLSFFCSQGAEEACEALYGNGRRVRRPPDRADDGSLSRPDLDREDRHSRRESDEEWTVANHVGTDVELTDRRGKRIFLRDGQSAMVASPDQHAETRCADGTWVQARVFVHPDREREVWVIAPAGDCRR